MPILKSITNKDTAIYLLIEVVSKAPPFLLIPALTYHLTPDDYGLYSLFLSMVSLSLILVGLKTNGYIFIKFFKEDADTLGDVYWNVIYLSLATFLLTIPIFIFLYLINIDPRLVTILFLATLSGLFSFQIWSYTSLLQAYEYPHKILRMYFMLAIVFLSSNLIAIYTYNAKITVIIAAHTFAYGLLAVSLTIITSRNVVAPKIFSKQTIKEASIYGVSLLPHSVSTWARNGGDKFVILLLLSMQFLGIYSLSMQLAAVAYILSYAYLNAVKPNMFKFLSMLDENDNNQRRESFNFSNALYMLILIFVLTSIFIYFLAPLLIGIEFSEAINYSLMLLVGNFFLVWQMLSSQILFHAEKTKTISYISFISTLFFLTCIILFIRIFGESGVIYAYIVSNIFYLILSIRASRKITLIKGINCFN